MLIFVSHCYGGDKKNIERAKKITRGLQIRDPANCYICPLTAFSHLEYGEMGYDAEMELCLDLLSMCDRIIVSSEISKGMRMEIDFAKLVKMEVMRLEENGSLRYFTE